MLKQVIKNIFFSPISVLWELVYIMRRSAYTFGIFRSHKYDIPVISVGNVTFGGTGKTPFTIWLSKYFLKQDKSPMILTRGYKGALESKSGLILGGERFKMNPERFGDEALVIARRLTKGGVVVGKNRSKNLEYYFNQINPDVVLLDDGFQHLKLTRGLNIVLFDCLLPLSQYKVAPKGYLREGLTALKDAHAIVLSRSDQVTAQKKTSLINLISNYTRKDVIFSEIRYVPTGVFDPSHSKVWGIEELAGKRVLALAAVASPKSFFTLLDSLGADVIDRESFPDHHYFTIEELKELTERAKKKDAVIITSEKDIVKIKRISTEVKILYLEIQVDFVSGREELENLISQEQRV